MKKSITFVTALCFVCLSGCAEEPDTNVSPGGVSGSGGMNPADNVVCPSWALEMGGVIHEGNWGVVQRAIKPWSAGFQSSTGVDEDDEPILSPQPYITIRELEDQGEAGLLLAVTITVGDVMYISDFTGATAHWTDPGTSSGVVQGTLMEAVGEQREVGFRLTYKDFPVGGDWDERYTRCY